MILFYHGDMDGIAAGNIYLENYPIPKFRYIKAYEFEYDKEDAIYDILIPQAKVEEVIFVDCCPSEDVLKAVCAGTKTVTILDHHISKKQQIDDFYKEGLIDGMSYIGASATLITWCWFHFNKNIEKITMFLDKFGKSRIAQDKSDVPLSIKLVNSWDIWNGLYIDAEPYKVYFECQNLTPVDDEVKELLSNDIKVNKAIIEGNIMLKFYHNWGKQYCERYGYPIQYKKNDFFVLNVGNANSKIFGDIINDYDAVIIYCNNGVKYKCSIYSAKDFDCAKFAEQFGGGGHKGAAGFVIDELPVWLRDRKSGLFFKED